MDENKSSPPRRRAALVDECACQRTMRLRSVIQTKRSRPSRREVGSGRRERGNANRLNILGGILLPIQDVSIPNLSIRPSPNSQSAFMYTSRNLLITIIRGLAIKHNPPSTREY